MRIRRVLVPTVLALVVCVGGVPPGVAPRGGVAAEALGARLTDQEFWRLVTELSEPDGNFRSDNLLSNETKFQYVIPTLSDIAKPGRAYLGVGPEQNFTYIAALKPRVAFIVDIRRGNLDLQLMYKALFELSANRADFVSRLFSRRRPDGLTLTSTTAEIFAAYAKVEPSAELYYENLKAIQNQLVVRHGFKLPAGDLTGLDYVYKEFFSFGPDVQYSSRGTFGGNYPTYGELMVVTDTKGRPHGYLSSEELFRVVKDLEARNLIVPVVGNFAGPKAIRAVGRYLKQKDTIVSAFYLSNVEQYLKQDNVWDAFCANAATLPVDGTSLFIRSGRFGTAPGLSSELGTIEIEVGESCAPNR